MDKKLLQKLKNWRDATAQNEGVEPFRILPNKTIENIARAMPITKEELLAVKGIKEKKFEKYGKDILTLVNEKDNDEQGEGSTYTEGKSYTVSSYLNLLNQGLREQKARVRGEISSLDVRENYLFFSLKDKDDESLLNCFMWAKDYWVSGASLEEGTEIIVGGFSEIYKPNGRLTFRVASIELVGEGALKKAYDQLKKKLESEGLFALERKQPLSELPQKIGLITSETGEVIHDFLTNLGKYGYQIKFVNSRVEGQAAVRDLLSAIDYFAGKDTEVLVVIRGGGSLESLQAFNNEVLVRKIANFKVPVICGIGHERDVPLASLAADLMVSTPTVAAVVLNQSWERALTALQIFERDTINKYGGALASRRYQLEILTRKMREKADFIFKRFERAKQRLNAKLITLGYALKDIKKKLDYSLNLLLVNFQKNLDWLSDYLKKTERRLKIADPRRQLKLGYSIVSLKDRIVKSIKQANVGEKLDIRVSDGKIGSKVTDIE